MPLLRGKKKPRRAIKETIKFYRDDVGVRVPRKEIVRNPKLFGVDDIDREIKKFEKEYSTKPKKQKSRGRGGGASGGGGGGVGGGRWHKDPKTGRRVWIRM